VQERGTEQGYQYGTQPTGDEYEKSQTQEMGEQVQEKTREYTEQVKDKASEYGEKAQEQVEAGKDMAAERMESAATVIREKAGQSGLPAEAGEKLATGMEKTAGYLREHDTTQMMDDLETYVRSHPMKALAGAIFAGFVIGRVLR
jgi:ElaB/YqjD/DUF883 family membrane-anchored ribosome-binding protein